MTDRQIIAKFFTLPTSEQPKPLPPDERRKHLELAARHMKLPSGLMADGSTPEAWVEAQMSGKGRHNGQRRT
jgi:hypothetical protein